ncbi:MULTISPECIES: ABC transporter permease [Acidithiobacillus]|jgi:ABC-type nitrate/sulfonate/bicarbonate transport system, permease component|uniref:ABC transporter permease n=2 Tax=Acidithiobacillus ferriphilus TaxID=1689834 RepID=A0ABU6FVW4_9PROT|nr:MULTISPECIES: ABC transporter permease [Acidithiobacillus]MBU2786367.1 ABC transporter permease [Acidithiobacillus ferriphilus]MBU2830187.1 ABC transporter permease [Acidithiobacillus ferriphilus]MBU2833808.1 ABC transporter permease [Acidithiobacillus ferriphilus]MBU2853426.1 ABC transporter permease [Acidithiobacillus ferriphilus]MBW9249724.1 ABC transporter permease subunit [Acidithiobacillus ferriphilus]
MIASDHEQDHKPQTFNDHVMKTSSFSVNYWLDYIVRLFYIGKHSVRIFVIPLLSIMVGLLAWQGLTQTHADIILDFSNIPSPLHVYKSFLNVVVTKTYWKDIYWSLYRIALAFTIGSLVGVTVGVALGYSAILRLIIAPYIEIMRPIPAIAWVPMSILMWPTTEQSIVFITFLGAVFPIVLNTWDGVKRVPIELVKAARSLGANRISVLFHVVIPYAIPNITVGMALGMGAAWFALLAGEMISGRYGIGYFTWESYELIQYGNIIVGMLTIGILSSITSGAIYLIKRKIVPWSE